AFSLVTPTSAVEGGAREYFSIRIWSAPFTLFNMVILGWFIGRQQANLTLFLQLFVNGTNALLDAVFVLHMGWGVEGIATGTVIAEIAAAVVGYLLVVWQLNPSRRNIDLGSIFEWPALRQTLTVNRHLMVRTFFIVFVFAFFTAKSAESGEILLAANAILMHFVFFTAYLLDGFAFAAETFVGEAIGMGSRSRLQRCINLSTVLSGVTASIVSLGIYCFGSLIIDVLTVSPEVRLEGRIYLDWLTILPLVSFWCWQLDGIFIGALRSEPMQNATFWAWCGFMASWTILQDGGNHGLWLTMILFNIMRGVFLGWYLPSLVRSIPQTRA
ncbi:MAG: MATE family efflux transporter, partial [Methylococcales bacterium]|nr:MATE family efflux transporter [Methylococcales bacterium]